MLRRHVTLPHRLASGKEPESQLVIDRESNDRPNHGLRGPFADKNYSRLVSPLYTRRRETDLFRLDVASEHAIAWDLTHGRGHAMPDDTKPTVTVTESGGIAAATPHGSYRQGFADLLDFTAPPAKVAILPPGAPTAIGFSRTGQALRNAMAAFRESKP